MIDDGLENNPLVSRRELSKVHEGAFMWALSLTGRDREAAEDVIQQAYLRVVEGRARFEGRATLKTWLFSVIRNVARHEHRRGLLHRFGLTRLGLLEVGTEAASPDSRSPHEASADESIRASMRRLSPRQREVLELVIDAEFTLEEVAAILGISLGSARTHYHRAKQQLRRDLAGRIHE
ncbi:MAG: sigma-70 family RNA polymerase sigma factor [Pseudomonadales bacterium]|nr:sigma-70 family RNA polymerase sigma factor [Pseudomonadales bacterium]